MRRALLVLASLALPGFTIASHATPITAGVYNLSNASVGGYTVTGTVTVSSAGSATASNLTFNDQNFNNPGLPTFNTVSSTSVYNGLSQNYLQTSSNGGQIALFFNTTADANGNFDLCLANVQCGTSSGTVDPSTLQIYGFYNSAMQTNNSGMSATNFSNGYLTSQPTSASVATTPEPSTIVMLGTGVLGMAGMASRRLRCLRQSVA